MTNCQVASQNMNFSRKKPIVEILALLQNIASLLCRYAIKTIKMLPEKPDAILLDDIFLQISRLGAIHPVFQTSADP
jgi:hypothetical protein